MNNQDCSVRNGRLAIRQGGLLYLSHPSQLLPQVRKWSCCLYKHACQVDATEAIHTSFSEAYPVHVLAKHQESITPVHPLQWPTNQPCPGDCCADPSWRALCYASASPPPPFPPDKEDKSLSLCIAHQTACHRVQARVWEEACMSSDCLGNLKRCKA